MSESSPTNASPTDSSPTDSSPTDSSPTDNSPTDSGPSPDETAAADDTSPPLNRAARRGKGRGHDTVPGPERSFGSRARSAQGRRFNPIRRTGS